MPLSAGETMPNAASDETNGRTLHREFVGMLFALAIAQVAIEAAEIVNSPLGLKECLPAYSHLFLAATVITASWVGWGQSKEKLTDIRNIFTRELVELALDLLLVAAYYVIVMGVELPSNASDDLPSITPSLDNEAFWMMMVFVLYFIWDCWTKLLEDSDGRSYGERFPKRDEHGRIAIFQRGWASLTFVGLAILAYCALPRGTSDPSRVILADLALLSLAILFRAMKLKSWSDLAKSDGVRIVVCGTFFVLLLEGSTHFTSFGRWFSSGVGSLLD